MLDEEANSIAPADVEIKTSAVTGMDDGSRKPGGGASAAVKYEFVWLIKRVKL